MSELISSKDDAKKPNTVNLNGVDVGLIHFCGLLKENQKRVTLEFKTEEEADHFCRNAMKIFHSPK